METKVRLTIEAVDPDGLYVGLKLYESNKDRLPRKRHQAVFGTFGTTEFVRDYSLFGTAERPIIYVGASYATPEWMFKDGL